MVKHRDHSGRVVFYIFLGVSAATDARRAVRPAKSGFTISDRWGSQAVIAARQGARINGLLQLRVVDEA